MAKVAFARDLLQQRGFNSGQTWSGCRKLFELGSHKASKLSVTDFEPQCSSSSCFSGAVSSSNSTSSAQPQRQFSVSNGPLQLPTGHRSGGRPSIAQATAPGALGSKVVCSGYAQQQCPATRLRHVSGSLGSIVCRSSSSLQGHRLS